MSAPNLTTPQSQQTFQKTYQVDVADNFEKLKSNLDEKISNASKKSIELKKLREENKELGLRIKELQEDLKKTRDECDKINEIANKTQEMVENLRSVKENESKDILIHFCSKIAKLKTSISEIHKDYNSFMDKKEILEEYNKRFKALVIEFNYKCEDLIKLKFLDKIIDLNKSINQGPADKAIITNRDNQIRKLNEVLTELRQCSDLLKSFLLDIHPEDPRLKAKGLLTYVGKHITSSRVFNIPGGEGFYVTAKTLDVSNDWKYESIAPFHFTEKAVPKDLVKGIEPNEKKEEVDKKMDDGIAEKFNQNN